VGRGLASSSPRTPSPPRPFGLRAYRLCCVIPPSSQHPPKINPSYGLERRTRTHTHTHTHTALPGRFVYICRQAYCLQCFDTVGWAEGHPACKKNERWCVCVCVCYREALNWGRGIPPDLRSGTSCLRSTTSTNRSCTRQLRSGTLFAKIHYSAQFIFEYFFSM